MEAGLKEEEPRPVQSSLKEEKPQPVQPENATVEDTNAAYSIEFLPDESRTADFIESIVNWAADRNGGYRVFVTAENGLDQPGSVPYGLPLREEAYLGHMNAGKIGLVRVFLDGRVDEEGKHENVARWMITLRNRVGTKYRDELLRQVVVRGVPFMQLFMCVPRREVAHDSMPVHVIIGLKQPLNVSKLSTTVHLTIRYSVFQKSFFSDWVKFMQTYPSYDYNQQEEQKVLNLGFEVLATDFDRVDPRAVRFLTERMTSTLELSPSPEPSPVDERREEAVRALRDEFLRDEWMELVRALSKVRELLSSSFEFSTNFDW